MKRVKFLTDTAYQGPRREGDEINVPDDYALRWEKNGIAKIMGDEYITKEEHEDTEVEKTVEDEEITNEVVSEEEVEDFTNMNAKELFAKCKERGLEVEAKKSREYYIEKLTSN